MIKVGILMAELTQKTAEQTVSLVNRKVLDLSGVTKVDSFDSQLFVLKTVLGDLTIKGYGLHMKHLNLESGLVTIEGNVHSLSYSDSASGAKKKSFVGQLFK